MVLYDWLTYCESFLKLMQRLAMNFPPSQVADVSGHQGKAKCAMSDVRAAPVTHPAWEINSSRQTSMYNHLVKWFMPLGLSLPVDSSF